MPTGEQHAPETSATPAVNMPGAQSEEYLKRLAANPALENIISFPKGGAVKANPLYEKQKELFTTILTENPEKQ